ncbi:MAG TPA: hypothetical protein VMW17_06070 [Candidatus Binatia bacterium]|nr:hypothetical protein [Candidatus Binatia bacterium]
MTKSIFNSWTAGIGVAVIAGVTLGLAPHAARAAFSSGSTGADGAFNPTCSPTPCTVETALPDSGIFNFTTVNIAAGVTATFSRNTSNTPVTILATGDVNVLGAIDVSGLTAGPSTLPGRSGPGGFDGGVGASVVAPNGGTGLGPGGGGGGIAAGNTANNKPGGGGFGSAGGTANGGTPSPAGASYGVPTLIPIIGGSGGGGGAINGCGASGGGGGGGGAILIASSGTITVTGTVAANGGSGGLCANNCASAQSGAGGAGGGIRLVANSITGVGTISANGGAPGPDAAGCSGPNGAGGGFGRIRLEAVNLTFAGTVGPVTSGFPGPVNVASFPMVGIVSVNGVNAPVVPRGSFDAPADVTLSPVATNPVTVSLKASNVPLGTLIAVTVTPQTGAATTVNSTPLTGSTANSTATASVTLPNGISVVSAAATFATPN